MNIPFPDKKIHKCKRRWSFFYILPTFAFAMLGVCPLYAQIVSPELDSLIARAEREGEVRVIVKLRIPELPEELPIRQRLAARKPVIAERQEILLQDLAPFAAELLGRMTYIPKLGLKVDAAALRFLANHPLVVRIYEDRPIPPSLQESIPHINADDAWEGGYSGDGYAIAIIDTGVDGNHPFLSGKVVSEACYSSNLCPGGGTAETGPGSGVNCPTYIDGCDHGSHVAGIAAGNGIGMPGVGFAGVARDAHIIAIQVFSEFSGSICTGAGMSSPCALANSMDIERGLDRIYVLFMEHNFSIVSVNMSLGEGRYTSPCDSHVWADEVDVLKGAEIATIAASGNTGYIDALNAPACISSAISVGSTQDGSGGTVVDAISGFSNSANFLDLLAPGEWIYSSVPGAGYDDFRGTSMAAPHVAGAWAVMKARNPAASVDDVLNALETTGTSIYDARNGVTSPRINVDAALNALAPPSDAKLVSLGAEDNGYAVAVSGKVAVTGAPGTFSLRGEAYVHQYSGSAWTQTSIVALDGALGDRFGRAVDVDGDWIVIGAPFDDDQGASSGSAYVFTWDGAFWNQQTKLTVADGAAYDAFGDAVALSGDVLMIGARGDDDRGFSSGSVYVFRWNGTSWIQETKLTANDGAGGDYFGEALALNGNVAVIGARGDDDHGSGSGAVYIFRWNGTSWIQETKLTPNDGAAYDNFGDTVSLSGNVALIGAPGDDDNGSGSGSVYVFRWNGSSWAQEAKVTAGGGGDHFGASVALSGNLALIGAYGDDDQGNNAGASYLFRQNGTLSISWTQVMKLTAYDGAADDEYGKAVALNGNVALIGAPGDDGDQGAAYVEGDAVLKSVVFQADHAIQVAKKARATLPKTYTLDQNYPNPFNPHTEIRFQLPRREYVVLTLYNALGRSVATLVKATMEAGSHRLKWNASEFPSGIYFYHIQAGSFTATKRMILMK